MIKKAIILLILGGLGYVGYLVWERLSPREQETVSKKLDKTVQKAVAGGKDLADKAADKLIGVAKDGIEKMEETDTKKAEKPSN